VTVDVTGPERLGVFASESLEAALKELLINAVIHNDRETPEIQLTIGVDNSRVKLSVRDNGPGLSEFDKDVLESGGAIDAVTHGSGLGLWLVYWAVRRSRGKIQIEDCEPRGTEITIRLPQVVDN